MLGLLQQLKFLQFFVFVAALPCVAVSVAPTTQLSASCFLDLYLKGATDDSDVQAVACKCATYKKLPPAVRGQCVATEPIDACTELSPSVSASAVAVVKRGGCSFADKMFTVQAAGYQGLIIIDSGADHDNDVQPPELGNAAASAHIPVAMVSRSVGDTLLSSTAIWAALAVKLPAVQVRRGARQVTVLPLDETSSRYWWFQFQDPGWRSAAFTAIDALLHLAEGRTVVVDMSATYGATSLYTAPQAHAVYAFSIHANMHMHLQGNINAGCEGEVRKGQNLCALSHVHAYSRPGQTEVCNELKARSTSRSLQSTSGVLSTILRHAFAAAHSVDGAVLIKLNVTHAAVDNHSTIAPLLAQLQNQQDKAQPLPALLLSLDWRNHRKSIEILSALEPYLPMAFHTKKLDMISLYDAAIQRLQDMVLLPAAQDAYPLHRAVVNNGVDQRKREKRPPVHTAFQYLDKLTFTGQRWRLLVCIAMWGQHNRRYMERVIQEYDTMGVEEGNYSAWDVTVVLHTDSRVENLPRFRNLHIVQQVTSIADLPGHNPEELLFLHRRVMLQNLTKYDVFVSSENDMLVTRRNIATFLRLSAALDGTNAIPGFMRFEEFSHGRQRRHFLPDLSTKPSDNLQPSAAADLQVIREQTFFRLHNNHQAVFVALPYHLRRVADLGLFQPDGVHDTVVWGYDLMCSSTVVLFNAQEGAFEKLVSLCDMDDILVHHLPNKYVQDETGFWAVDDLQKLYAKSMKCK